MRLVTDAPNMSARNNLAQLHAHLGKTYATMAAATSNTDPEAKNSGAPRKKHIRKASTSIAT